MSRYINDDCMKWLKTFPDDYFDVAIVDPPYGIDVTRMNLGAGGGANGGDSTVRRLRNKINYSSMTGGKFRDHGFMSKDKFDWDSEQPGNEYFSQLFRVSKDQIIFGMNYFNLPPCRCFIVWDKKQCWENFSQAELAWTSFDMPSKVFSRRNTGGKNVPKIHPTQKPIELYDWICEKFLRSGMSVIDTHVGSASSLISYANHGIEFMGFEINEVYYRDSLERFIDETSQMTIFNARTMLNTGGLQLQ